MVIRDGELVFMSPQQQHEFNFPYQIGSADSMSDTPQVVLAAGEGSCFARVAARTNRFAARGTHRPGLSAECMLAPLQVAQRFSVEVRQGDIVVAATDGLFDNVYPDEAASLVSASKERGENAQAVAVTLAQFARMRAADPTHLSPFAYGAQQLGYRYFGGKMDDITIVVAFVVAAAQPKL